MTIPSPTRALSVNERSLPGMSGRSLPLVLCWLMCAEALVGGFLRPAANWQICMYEKDAEPNLAVKSVWFGAELFGKVAKLVRSSDELESSATDDRAPASLGEAIERLQRDYEGTLADPRPYFLTGVMDEALYDEDCEFADPFVSFNGRQRFVDNLSNLAGGFITEASTRVLSTERGPSSYSTKLLVKLRLGLPWKPVLAWPWGVLHEFDEDSGLIVRHIESWEVSPAEGVKQLFTRGDGKSV